MHLHYLLVIPAFAFLYTFYVCLMSKWIYFTFYWLLKVCELLGLLLLNSIGITFTLHLMDCL